MIKPPNKKKEKTEYIKSEKKRAMLRNWQLATKPQLWVDSHETLCR